MRKSRRFGFTLIELLVTISIIGVLIALLLPAVQAAREAARKTGCVNNLRQIGIALHNYNESQNSLPPGYVYRLGYSTGGFGWAAAILPQMEQKPLFDAINYDLPAWSAPNVTACTQSLAVYLCPSDYTSVGFLEREGFRYARSSYVASFGPMDLDLLPEDRRGLFSRNSRTRLAEVTDGLSQTIAGGERSNALELVVIGSAGHFDLETVWAGAIKENPVDDHGHTTLFQTAFTFTSPGYDDRNAMSFHPGGMYCLFGDGSVRFLKNAIALNVYRALGTRAGGDVVSSDQY